METAFRKTYEEIPQAKPEAQFLIHDLSLKVIKGISLDIQEHETINQLIIELEELDRDIVSYLSGMELDGVITKDEAILTAAFFLVSKQIGPACEELRNTIYNGQLSEIPFDIVLHSVSLPNGTSQLMKGVYRKLTEILS